MLASEGDLTTVSHLMAQILHLLEKYPDYQTQTAVLQLVRGPTTTCIRTIGRGGDFSTVLAGLTELRRCECEYDLIHAWGVRALMLAALASEKPIVYSPCQFPSLPDIRWMRAIMSVRNVQAICPTDTTRRRLVQRGVPIDRCHLIRPGVDFSRIIPRRDLQLRSALGFAGDDFILLAAGESLRPCNHRAAILAAAVLHVFDPRHKLLLWGRGPMVELEKSYALKMLPRHFVVFATDRLGGQITFEQLLSAADAALVTADAPAPTLPVAACMAAGLPIVAVVSETVSEMLEDRHTCLMVGRCTSRLIAQRVLDLHADSRLCRKIADSARAEAYEFFSMTRFVQQCGRVYDMALNREILRPAAGVS